METQLSLIDISDLEIANKVISSINKFESVVVKFSELTPLSFQLIHHSMKLLNPHHYHYTRCSIFFNDELKYYDEFDMSEFKNFYDGWIRLSGMPHSRDWNELEYLASHEVIATTNYGLKAISKLLKQTSNYNFINFKWDALNLKKSDIEFNLSVSPDYPSYVSCIIRLFLKEFTPYKSL